MSACAWRLGAQTRSECVRQSKPQLAEELPAALIAPRPAPSAGATSDGDYPGQREAQGSDLLRRVGPASGAPTTAASCFPEQKAHFWCPGPRLFVANGNGHYRIEQRFKGLRRREALRSRSAPPRPVRSEGPRYGPGPAKRGGFSALRMVSSRGYGFLWNSPAVGGV